MFDSLPVSYYQNLASDQQLADILGKLMEILRQRPIPVEHDLAISIEYLKDIVAGTPREFKDSEVSDISELGMQLLETLYFETRKTVEQQQLFNYIALAFAYWVARQGGKIKQLEFPVNALAQIANTLHDKTSLESLYEAATFIITQTEESVIDDIDTAAPGNPWKVLIINYGIIATRTHTPELMESAYQTLERYFPNELSGFFTQAMAEMTRLNYPQHVRTVVERYYQKYKQA